MERMSEEQAAELERLEALAEKCLLPDTYVSETGETFRSERLDWYSTCAGEDFMRGVMPSLFIALLAERREREALLQEAFDALCDGDPIACHCEKTDGEKTVVPKYAGECLLCRLRAVLTPEGKDNG